MVLELDLNQDSFDLFIKLLLLLNTHFTPHRLIDQLFSATTTIVQISFTKIALSLCDKVPCLLHICHARFGQAMFLDQNDSTSTISILGSYVYLFDKIPKIVSS